jgi:3D (Asp-Asp-Asp) domain-containing protein
MKAMARSQFPLVSAGVFAAALVAVVAVQVVDPRHAVLPSASGGSAGLAACPFWTSDAQPPGAVTSFAPPPQQAPALDLGGRLPAPATVSGQLSGQRLALSFDRVPGAQAYRVWRDGQPIALVPDQGRPSLAITDPHPCAGAFYTVQAIADQAGADAARGQLSRPYQLAADGTVQPWSLPGDPAMQMTVVSYSDAGQAASGYDTRPGICAVDPRVVPWGISFAVPDYGRCYAADVRPAAQGRTVAVWLPASQAAAWGVQDRVITLGPGPGRPAPPAAPSPSPSPSHRATPSPSPGVSPSPSPGTTASPAPPASPPQGTPSAPPPAPTNSPSPPFRAGYEAESAANTLAGGARVGSCSACSGGQKVGFVGMGGSVRFNGVTVPSAGSYHLTIGYCDGSGRSAVLSVNGGSARLIPFTSTGSFSTPGSLTVTVSLNAGANTIAFSNPSAWAPDFDRITVST